MQMQTMICLCMQEMQKCNEMQDGAAKRPMNVAVRKTPNHTRGHLLKMQNILGLNAQKKEMTVHYFSHHCSVLCLYQNL